MRTTLFFPIVLDRLLKHCIASDRNLQEWVECANKTQSELDSGALDERTKWSVIKDHQYARKEIQFSLDSASQQIVSDYLKSPNNSIYFAKRPDTSEANKCSDSVLNASDKNFIRASINKYDKPIDAIAKDVFHSHFIKKDPSSKKHILINGANMVINSILAAKLGITRDELVEQGYDVTPFKSRTKPPEFITR